MRRLTSKFDHDAYRVTVEIFCHYVTIILLVFQIIVSARLLKFGLVNYL